MFPDYRKKLQKRSEEESAKAKERHKKANEIRLRRLQLQNTTESKGTGGF